MAYWIERLYPLILSGALTFVLNKINIDPFQSKNINEVVNGIVTLESIIIGFIGAIIPVILSMKNESKLVQYVFAKDEDGLFKKYLSSTIAVGLMDVCVSLLVYLRDIILTEKAMFALRICFIYFFFLFMFCTFRSMSCMLKLIFANDTKLVNDVSNNLEATKKSELWEKRGR